MHKDIARAVVTYRAPLACREVAKGPRGRRTSRMDLPNAAAGSEISAPADRLVTWLQVSSAGKDTETRTTDE
jgi:hypothetical protein